MKKTIIISLGGSCIVPTPSLEINTNFLKQFRSLIARYLKQNKNSRVVIICGGGKLSSHYNLYVKRISEPTKTELDWLGIMATRLNAELVKMVFGSHAFREVIYNPTEKLQTSKKVIIGAGWLPGCSTDKDAVLAAMNFKADTIINMTNIDYVYDSDPKKNKSAKPLHSLSWRELRKIVGNTWSPRLNAPFDPIAAKIAQKQHYTVIIANGQKLKNLENILQKKKYIGTTIR